MSALAALEFANSAFYDAFSAASLPQMTELWAASGAVFCCHPGWQPIHGREKVLRSWAELFSNAGPMPIAHHVLARDLIGLQQAGGNIYYLGKYAGLLGLDVQDWGAMQTGLTKAAFTAMLYAAAA